jgi:hypothetical protein
MRAFLLWCAIVYSARAQQASSVSTSTSNGTSIPWITYTCTRSCTSRPSTVYVYTSNSSSFLLTLYGPSSTTTPAESNSIPTISNAHDTVASGFPLTVDCSRSFDGSPATSQPPFSVIPGSICPLPSTVTVSAPPSNVSCELPAEKTVTSYVLTSCAVHNGSSITPSIVQSIPSEQLATPRQSTNTELSTNKTLGASPSNATLASVGSTLSNDSFTNLCTSFTERTITVEHTIERTVSAPEPEPVYITFTTLQGISTIYQTSLSEHIAGTSRPPLDSISTSYTKLDNISTITRASGLQETSGRDLVFYTT